MCYPFANNRSLDAFVRGLPNKICIIDRYENPKTVCNKTNTIFKLEICLLQKIFSTLPTIVTFQFQNRGFSIKKLIILIIYGNVYIRTIFENQDHQLSMCNA